MPTCCSASDNSPFNTANTTWICSSADTCHDGFCCLLTQPSFPTPQLNPLPESLTHSTALPTLRPAPCTVTSGPRQLLAEDANTWTWQGSRKTGVIGEPNGAAY
jgi:hypothetical protein